MGRGTEREATGTRGSYSRAVAAGDGDTREAPGTSPGAQVIPARDAGARAPSGRDRRAAA